MLNNINTSQKLEVTWSQIKIIRLEKSDRCIILYKYNLYEPFSCAVIGCLPKRITRNATQPAILQIF